MRLFMTQLALLLVALIGVASQPTCTNGVVGVPGTAAGGEDVCCSAGCTRCGGSKCGSLGPGLDAEDCCTSRIVDANKMCGEAPCIITSSDPVDPPADSFCSNGVPGKSAMVGGVEVCCDPGCTRCGGFKCASSSVGMGANDCCTSRIIAADKLCGTAPCIVPGDDSVDPDDSVDSSTCSNGIPGVQGKSAEQIQVCCDPGCSKCGGKKCGSQAGFLGPADCCTSRIVDSGLVCGKDAGKSGNKVVAPCMIAKTCEDDDDCPIGGEICCPTKKVCETPIAGDPTACGDPHMTGFRGQMFDFTGIDGQWYALFSSPPSMHINMRVTTPLPEVPEITYITGLSIMTTDMDGLDHSIVVQVKNPSSLDTSCPAGVSPCLADGALTVVLDEQDEVLMSPGSVELAPGVIVSAVNLPGACRSFGFEKYWESKQQEYKTLSRRLTEESSQTMAEWILGDPTATNPDGCAEYVAHTMAVDDDDESVLFAHQSEHASFKIVTPAATIRLTHGKLHQVAEKDPNTQMELPDHLTWQMNLAIDSNTDDVIAGSDGSIVPSAKGILGETSVPTVDEDGEPIMEGMDAIRGTTEQYHVAGPLAVEFDLDHQW